MNQTKILFFIIAMSFLPGLSEARVFKFKDENFASYLRGTYGFSRIKKSTFDQSSGSGTVFDKSIDFNLSAEVGMLYNFRSLTIRAGILFILPTRHDDIKGTNSSGTELFNLESDVSVLAPSLFIESDFYKSDTFRAFLSAGAGFGIVDIKNVYTMTADGTTAFGVADYEEKIDEETLVGSASIGIEYLFADTVTMLWEVGYRHMVSDDFKHKRDVDTILGSVTRGQDVVNADGSKRSIDFSGIYAGVGFRFYIDILD